MAYQIFTDATADLSREMLAGLPPLEMFPMDVALGGTAYAYGPGGTITTPAFYSLQRQGNFASTSQISPSVYCEGFERCLGEGRDVLYLCFSSGLSGTYQSARLCAEELGEKYPDRSILCLDTLAASVGQGLLVCEALRKQAEGYSLERLANWVTENRGKVCHWFTVDTFEHLKHGGRVSAASAAIGTVLQIKPLLHVDEQGCLAVAEKPRGRKKAIASQLNAMQAGWLPELSPRIVIGHGDCPEGAQLLREAVSARFPEARIDTAEIGPVIGAHTGPGMLALVYWGSNR